MSSKTLITEFVLTNYVLIIRKLFWYTWTTITIQIYYFLLTKSKTKWLEVSWHYIWNW